MQQYPIRVVKTEFPDDYTQILTTTKPQDYKYLAGQYTKLTISHQKPDSRGVCRDFSFASHPNEGNLVFISRIPEVHSTYKEAMKNLTLGDTIEISIPVGHFILPDSPDTSMIWIAAGVGIAPFRGFVLSKLNFANTKLFFTNPNENYSFIEEFKYIDITKNNSKIDGHFTEITFSNCDKTALYYLCGNTKFILSVQQVLLKLGIKPSQFRKDVFTGY